MNELQRYIHVSKYARWVDDEGRRETWEETVKRYTDFWCDRIVFKDKGKMLCELQDAIENMEVMPSMRALWTAGKALDRDNASGYNCAGQAIKDVRYLDEMFYLLMCGCGDGFSVERQYISANKFPLLPEELNEQDITIRVRDSKVGWATALKELISLLYSGSIPNWDVSRVRPAGTRLKTFGGRASGPEPLVRLFNFCVATFKSAVGDGRERLNSLEIHDICCNIAEAVVAGNVRRAACISLSNLTDDRMRRAKTGQWWDATPYRQMANNSVAYTEKPDLDSFSKEWRTLYKSKSGERGIINKEALRAKAEECGREYEGDYVLNPCGEAILRDSGGLCNLSEVIVRPDDTLATLKRKVELATILGTLQSTLTDFRYLRKVWKDNAEEERLLGVSLTGIMDHPVLSGRIKPEDVHKTEFNSESSVISLFNLPIILKELKEVARETNKEWAKKLGINPSKQLTLIKPSGTVSLLTDTSSGIHPRFAPYYIRRVIQDNKDKLTDFMVDQGVPYVKSGEKTIFSFYVKAPPGATTIRDMSALEQLELWKIYRDHWCEGNPSQTIYYSDDEYFGVAQWVWDNWDSIGGLSFFPKNDHVYENAPFEEITEEQYKEATDGFNELDWTKFIGYEKEDGTSGAQEFACSGGACEI